MQLLSMRRDFCYPDALSFIISITYDTNSITAMVTEMKIFPDYPATLIRQLPFLPVPLPVLIHTHAGIYSITM